MTPDDPRHGTGAGYSSGCRQDCCRRAMTLATKRRRLALLNGAGPARIDSTGTRRRLEALMALGWRAQDIAEACGWATKQSIQQLRRRPLVALTSARKVADAYEHMSMTIPERDGYGERSRRYATKRGWVVPMAWDDIDDPAETPKGLTRSHERQDRIVDWVAVEAALAGYRCELTRAERRAAVARLTDKGLSTAQIAIRLRCTERSVTRARVALRGAA